MQCERSRTWPDTPARLFLNADGLRGQPARARSGEFRNYTGTDPLGFVISRNVRRRHLTNHQRVFAAIVV